MDAGRVRGGLRVRHEFMDVILFWKGLLAGLAVAAPVGPIGILCIQRALSKGREHGLVSGLGAATADALAGFVAASGLLFIETFLHNNQDWLQVAGGILLCVLGFRTFLSRPHPSSRPIDGLSFMRDFTSVFLLALTSPATILPMIMLLVGLKINLRGDMVHAALLMVGVFLGSISWWVVLSLVMGWLRAKSDMIILKWVNRIGGALLTGFGMLIFLRVLF